MPTLTRPAACALAAFLLALVVLAGCGDSGDETSAAATTTGAATSAADASATDATTATDGGEPALDPHIAAEQAVTAFLASPDSDKVCKNVLSPSLLEATYGDLAGCVNGRPPASLAQSVDVTDTTVSGDSVKATAVPTGGAYDEAKLRFELTVSGRAAVIDALDTDIPVGP